MPSRRVLVIGLLWLLSLGIVATVVRAQSTPGTILMGPDFGFQITGSRNGRPIGTLVVRLDGKWVPVQLDFAARGGIQPLTMR